MYTNRKTCNYREFEVYNDPSSLVIIKDKTLVFTQRLSPERLPFISTNKISRRYKSVSGSNFRIHWVGSYPEVERRILRTESKTDSGPLVSELFTAILITVWILHKLLVKWYEWTLSVQTNERFLYLFVYKSVDWYRLYNKLSFLLSRPYLPH